MLGQGDVAGEDRAGGGQAPFDGGVLAEKYGLAACGAKKYARRGALDRDELKTLAESGATVDEIARELDRNSSTVRYWLRRYEIETINPRGKCLHVANGSRFATFRCCRHGLTEFVLEGRGYYRCKRCRAAGVAKRRRTVKRQLVEDAGGACVLCGYARWLGALQFHHVDPEQKKFHIAQRGYSRSIARCRAEVSKCALLCANCHAEVEGGFATLPMGSDGSLVETAES